MKLVVGERNKDLDISPLFGLPGSGETSVIKVTVNSQVVCFGSNTNVVCNVM